MQKENITDKLLNLVCSIKYEDIPASALNKLRECLADTIGVTFAGASDLRPKEEELLHLLDDGAEVISPIGFTKRTSLPNAILINGLSAHFLELDDGVRYGVIHPSAPIFSALIPVAIVKNVLWEQFVLGAICSYEIAIRIASAMQPSHYSRGYHPTATCCTLGVAVGVAVMLGFSKEEIKDGFGAATISACGTLKVLEDVSELKPYNCAKAALMGYYSAMMGKAGFKSPNNPLQGDTGFLSMMADGFDEERLVGKSEKFAIEKVYLKPYASCRHTHPEIEACFMIRQNPGFIFENIDKVKVTTYKGVIGKHDFRDIYGESSARMSIPYSVAIALKTGMAGIAEFTEPYVSDKTILDLTQKIDVVPDDALSKLVPDKRVAIVDVWMIDGKVLSATVEYPKGEPENPLTLEENMTKFISMTSHARLSNEKSLSIFNEITHSQNPDLKILW